MARRKPQRRLGRYTVWGKSAFNGGVSVPKGSDRVMGSLKSYAYHSRIAGLQVNLDEPASRLRFGTPGQRMTLDRYKHFADNDVSVPPRVFLLRGLEKLKIFGEEINWHQTVLLDEHDFQLSLYFSSDMAFFLKVEHGIAMKSIVYYNTRAENARVIAQTRLRQNMIKWADFITVQRAPT